MDEDESREKGFPGGIKEFAPGQGNKVHEDHGCRDKSVALHRRYRESKILKSSTETPIEGGIGDMLLERGKLGLVSVGVLKGLHMVISTRAIISLANIV